MGIATLSEIITKVRKLTGSGTSLQLTDAQIIDYINSFYLYDFPAEFRSLKLKDRYTFNTERGIDTYPFDSERWTTVDNPVACMNRVLALYQQPEYFANLDFNMQFQQILTQATAAIGAGPYSGTVQGLAPGQPNSCIIRSTSNNPMVVTTLSPTSVFPGGYPPSNPNVTPFGSQQANFGRVQNILITTNVALGNTLNVTDDGAGNLIGDCLAGGTINYATGVVANLTFTSVLTPGQNIYIQCKIAQMNIPQGLLFYQNQFTLRPVPDKGYTITMVAYRQPSQALLGSQDPENPTLTGVPEQLEWWEVLAVGAAKKIYEDRLDTDGVMVMDKTLRERYSTAEARTYAQLGTQRVNTIYAGQLGSNYYGVVGQSWATGIN